MSLVVRLLASPRFRRWAVAFPPTRPVARRRAGALFGLATGFVHSQVLLAAVRLGLPERLAAGAATAEDLAPGLGLRPDRARRLLDAASAIRLARRRRDGRYALGPLGAALVGNEGVRAMVEHHALLYEDLRDPVALLRDESPAATRLASFWRYAADTPSGPAAAYSTLMARSQEMVADQVLAAWPVRRHRLILDVAGGDGAFLARVARAAPRARLALVDLAPVAALARQRFRAAGLDRRATAVAGDFRTDALPGGADLVTLVRVLHDHDDDTVRALLRAVRARLAPGGTLLVAEPMSDTEGAPAMGDSYFGLYLLAMGQGRPRRAAEIAAMLREAGFRHVRRVRTRIPLIASIITGS